MTDLGPAPANPRRGLSHCLHCGKAIPAEKKQNKFCDRSCAAKVNNRGVARHGNKHGPVLCFRCGQPILHTGKRYCSLKCANSRSADATARKLLGCGEDASKVSPQTVRAYLMKARGNQCEKCGWGERHLATGRVPLEVDHVNGEAADNRIENLRLLCPNCHSLTPTFRNLNKGKGREARRKERPLSTKVSTVVL